MELAVQAGSEAGKVFQIDRPLMYLGRQVGTEIQVNDSQVSRRHLQLENRSGQLYVTDLASANGSYINGVRLIPNQTQLLRPGDNLRVGDTGLLLRGIAANPSSSEATSVAGSYQAAIQVQPPPQNPAQPQPNYYNNNAGSGSPPQTFGNAPVPTNYPNQPSGYNQPQNYNSNSGQVGNYNQPPNYNNNGGQSGYPAAPFVPSGYNPNQPYGSGQNQGVAPVPAAKPRPNRTGLFAALAILLVAIVGGGAFAALNLLGNNSKPTPTAQAIVPSNGSPAPANTTPGNLAGNDTPAPQNNTTPNVANSTVAANNGTSVPNLTTTVARGNIGNNVPPPSPPKATAAPATTIRVATASAITPKPTTSASGNGSLVPIKALGVTVSFPGDWQTKADTTKNVILALATDNTTFVEVAKSSTFSGPLTSRANTVMDGTKTTYPDLVVTKAIATDSKGRAVVEYDYTDTSGGSSTLQHERMAVFQDPADSTTTYFVFYSTSKALFASQDATFQAIANSIGFTS